MKRDNGRGLGFLYMSVWDVNNVLRMHASQLQSPLPYNDDYYYYHYRNFLTGIFLKKKLNIALDESNRACGYTGGIPKRRFSHHTPLCETDTVLQAKKKVGRFTLQLRFKLVELATNSWREGPRCWIGFGQRGYI